MIQGTVTKTLRIPPKLAWDLKRIAAQHGTSENHEMAVALRAHIDACKGKT